MSHLTWHEIHEYAVQAQYELQEEVKRLKQIAVNAHDAILRGNDKEALKLLEGVWKK